VRVETHAAIGSAISRCLNLSPYSESRLVQGLKEPDQNAEWKKGAYRAHHGIHPHTIMHLIWRARQAYLARERERALETLGVALHFVQDMCVIDARGWHREIHDRIESEVRKLKIPVDAVREGVERAECSPHFVWHALYSIRPSADPAEALRSACYYSAAIAKAVCDSSPPPWSCWRRRRNSKQTRRGARGGRASRPR